MSQIKIYQGDKELTVNIKSVNCRYVDMSVRNDLSIDMKVPVGMSWEMIERYVRLNEESIFSEYERKKAKNHQTLPITLELENGKVRYHSGLKLPFLGDTNMKLRIKYRPDYNGTNVYVKKEADGGKSLVIRTDNDEQDFIRYCVIRFYRKCAERIVKKTLEEYASKLELSYNTFRITGKNLRSPIRYPRIASKNIDIKNQTTLWGSCNKKKNLKFDWKLAMLSIEIVQYIVVHELTHLKKMSHSSTFWHEVEKVMPEYNECQNWLTKHGKEYEIF